MGKLFGGDGNCGNGYGCTTELIIKTIECIFAMTGFYNIKLYLLKLF